MKVFSLIDTSMVVWRLRFRGQPTCFFWTQRSCSELIGQSTWLFPKLGVAPNHPCQQVLPLIPNNYTFINIYIYWILLMDFLWNKLRKSKCYRGFHGISIGFCPPLPPLRMDLTGSSYVKAYESIDFRKRYWKGHWNGSPTWGIPSHHRFQDVSIRKSSDSLKHPTH